MSGYVPGNTLAFGLREASQSLRQRARHPRGTRNIPNTKRGHPSGNSRPPQTRVMDIRVTPYYAQIVRLDQRSLPLSCACDELFNPLSCNVIFNLMRRMLEAVG